MSFIRTSRHLLHPDSGCTLPEHEVTPQAVYLERRRFVEGLAGAGALVGAGGLVGAPAWAQGQPAAVKGPGKLPALAAQRTALAGGVVTDKLTPYQDVTTHNNFYEFGTDKSDPAERAHTLKSRPWTLVIDGEVNKPQRLGLDDLLKLAPMEERIYRLRCVEGWSMVIPWVGYSLSHLIRRAEPTGKARYVEFVTLADPKQMPGLRSPVLDWPYVEGLRLDEAMHPLTLMAFGLYGEILPNQNGAPLRLVVPWKYGFKSAKSIVRIRLLDKPNTPSWVKAAPQEYGYFSNVNPKVDHPRWSQATERRIGEGGLFTPRRPTLMFNGYEAQVGQLYAGMDLKRHF